VDALTGVVGGPPGVTSVRVAVWGAFQGVSLDSGTQDSGTLRSLDFARYRYTPRYRYGFRIAGDAKCDVTKLFRTWVELCQGTDGTYRHSRECQQDRIFVSTDSTPIKIILMMAAVELSEADIQELLEKWLKPFFDLVSKIGTAKRRTCRWAANLVTVGTVVTCFLCTTLSLSPQCPRQVDFTYWIISAILMALFYIANVITQMRFTNYLENLHNQEEAIVWDCQQFVADNAGVNDANLISQHVAELIGKIEGPLQMDAWALHDQQCHELAYGIAKTMQNMALCTLWIGCGIGAAYLAG